MDKICPFMSGAIQHLCLKEKCMAWKICKLNGKVYDSYCQLIEKGGE